MLPGWSLRLRAPEADATPQSEATTAVRARVLENIVNVVVGLALVCSDFKEVSCCETKSCCVDGGLNQIPVTFYAFSMTIWKLV